MEHLVVNGWGDFQHYKDRDPPWIKLHRKVLDNYAFSRLQDASKAHLVLIWLLAARHGNHIPHDPAWIGQRIGATSPVELQPLIEAGFISVVQSASEPLAPRQRVVSLETEAETEAEHLLPRPGTRELTMRILGKPDRDAVVQFLEAVPASQSPETWAYRLTGYLDGLDGFSGPHRLTTELLASGCRDYLTEPRDFSPPHFRAFLRRVIGERASVKPIRGAEHLEQRIAENARSFLADRQGTGPAA
jgi:hypothetical protein